MEEAPRCTVDGQPVTELAVLLKPTAFFVTTEHGTHEITRCYFQRGEFSLGHDVRRLGGLSLERAEYSTKDGLLLHFTGGYEMSAPQGHCQATWRR